MRNDEIVKIADLGTYLFHKRMSIVDFSRQLNYGRDHLSRIVNGKLKLSTRLAKDIEQTDGTVTAKKLLGD